MSSPYRKRLARVPRSDGQDSPRVTNRTSVLRRSGKFKDAHPDRVQSDAMDGSQARRS